jgi:thiol-disulfide isomerase/thioredoxin
MTETLTTEKSFFQPWMFLLVMPLIGIIGMVIIIVGGDTGDDTPTNSAAQDAALLDDATPLPRTLPPRTPPPPPTSVFNNPVPDAPLRSLEGETFSLSDYRGQMLVVNFWATWCEPCIEEMPALQSFYENYEGDDLAMVLVTAPDAQQTQEDIIAFVDELEITLPVGLSENAQLNNLIGLRAMPSTYFIDEGGITRGMWMGLITEDDLQNEIDLLQSQ